MVNQNQKGKRIERELVNWFKEHGFIARRTHQYSGNKEVIGASDLIIENLPTWHVESKGIKNPKINRSTLISWQKQVTDDTPMGRTWVIMIKSNHGAWLSAVSLKGMTGLVSYPVLLTLAPLIETDDSINPVELLEAHEEQYQTERLFWSGVERKTPVVLYRPDKSKDEGLAFMFGETWLKFVEEAERDHMEGKHGHEKRIETCSGGG